MKTQQSRTEAARACGWESVTRQLLAALSVATSLWAPARAQNQDVDENFNGLSGTLDARPDWQATSAVTLSSNQVLIPTTGTSVSNEMYFRPTLPPTEPARWWTFDRTYGTYLRCEFKLTATVSSNFRSAAEEGHAAVYLAPVSLTPNDKNSVNGPLAVVELWADKNTAGGTDALLDVYGKGPSPPGTLAHLFGPVSIGSFSTSLKSVRVEFAWDYHQTPRLLNKVPPPPPAQRGIAWAYVRVSYDDGSGWTTVLPPLPPTSTLLRWTKNGWTPFGDDLREGLSGGTGPAKAGFDYYDWKAAASSTPVYPYFWFENLGTSLSDSVSWQFDDAKIYRASPPGFALMVNELGYDIAGPAWGAVRPNQVALLGSPGVVTSIDWSFLDSAGATLAAQTISYTTGEPSFREVTDLENWTQDPVTLKWGFADQQVYWWRWDVPAISPLLERTDCRMRAVVHYSVGGSPLQETLLSDKFNTRYELASRAVLPAVSTTNEFARRDPPPGTYGNGWYDAGNRYGEARSHAGLVSALTHVLRMRRPELSTAELRSGSAAPYSGYYEAIRWGADYLLSMGKTENQYAINAVPPRTHVTNNTTDSLKGHYFDNASATTVEIDGHVWEEHHLRLGYNPAPTDDAGPLGNMNKAARIYMACLGLIDAARTVKAYDTAAAATYATQATNTRKYLYDPTYGLAAEWSTAPDYFISYRAQALLDLFFYEYTGNSTDLADGMNKLRTDLDNLRPDDPTKVKYWIQNGIGGESSVYAPGEPIYHLLDKGITDTTWQSGDITWHDAAHAIAQDWYGTQIDSAYSNPLRTTKYWRKGNSSVDHKDYQGDEEWVNGPINRETHGVARAAQVLGRADSAYGDCVLLATGNMNWIQGLNFGVPGRQVTPATDVEHTCASLIGNLGGTWAQQTIIGLDEWTTPTTVNGFFGSPLDDTSSVGPEVPPWNYSASEYKSAESFILTDGLTILAAETLSRLLHPRLVVEAETYSAASGVMGVASNNSLPTYPNGGFSIGALQANNWLEYVFTPPEPSLGPSADDYNYEVLLRVSNTSSFTQSISLACYLASGGPAVWTRTVTVAPTAAQNDYRVVAPTTRVPLKSGIPYRIRITFNGGPCAFDAFVLKSAGIGS